MDKKKPKTIKMQYPAPYSQSWSTPAVKKPRKLNSAALASKPKVVKQIPTVSTDWLKRQSICRGSDPTAPHLKYGVFHNKRPLVRIQPRVQTNMKPQKYEFNMNVTSKPSINKKRNKRSAREDQFVDQLLDFCQLEEHNQKQLTKSEVKHVDIKPLRSPVVPTYRCRRSSPGSPTSRYVKKY